MSISPKPICEGTSTQLNAKVGDNFEYQWFLEKKIIANTNAIYKTNQAGSYEVKAFRNACEMTDTTFSLKFQPIPNVLNLGTKKSICPGDFLTLTPQNQVVYQWSSGEIGNKIQIHTLGKYVVKATLAGCDRKDSVEISFYYPPTITLKERLFNCFDINAFYILDAGIGTNYQYLWQPNNDINPKLSVSSAGKYSLKITSKEGCASEKNIEVFDECKPYLYLPQTFTPNQDGHNDQLKITISDYTHFEMRIFNRTGELIFFSNDPQKSWDGNYLNVLCPEGTYSYQVKLEWDSATNPIYQKEGVFLLVR